MSATTTSSEFFKDKRVRWALSHAVPVDQIIDKVYHGLAEPLTGPFLPGSSGYDCSLEPVSFDLAKSRELLDEAGWKDSDGDGVRDKEIEGQRLPARVRPDDFLRQPAIPRRSPKSSRRTAGRSASTCGFRRPSGP